MQMRPRALVVEDEKATRKLFRNLLEERGCDVDEAVDGQQAINLLDQHRYAVVATTRPDGRPQAAPLAFFIRDGSFWFASVAGQRLRNLRHVPYLAVVISEGDGGDHKLLTAEGTGILHPVTAELAACWANRHHEEPTWATTMIQVAPERLFSYQAHTTLQADE